MLSRFHLIPEGYGQTDGRTDRIAISISLVSLLTRDNNHSDVATYKRVLVELCTGKCHSHLTVHYAGINITFIGLWLD